MEKIRRLFTDDLILIIPLLGWMYAIHGIFIYPALNGFTHKDGFLTDDKKPIYWVSLMIQGISMSFVVNYFLHS